MIEDLIFKGRNLDEALSKAGNFYGTDINKLQYVCLEDSPEGEVWIRLTENPMAREYVNNTPQKPRFRERLTHQREDKPGTNRHQRPMRPRNRRVGNQQQSQKRHSSRQGYDRSRQPQQNNWKHSAVDTSWMGEVEKEAFTFVLGLLDKMKMRLDVYPVQDQSRLIFNIDGPDRSLFLAKKGSVLTAVQYLVNKIFMNRGSIPQKIFIDSKGYRVSREEELKEIARRSADKVKSSNKEYSLTPMNPYERRLIHLALKDDEEVTTVSRGEGFIKQVSIIPIEAAIKEGLISEKEADETPENQ